MFSYLRSVLDPNSSLSESAWQDIAIHLANLSVKKGDYILKTGQLCLAVYFVEQGSFRLFFDTDGEERNRQFFLEGSFMTDMQTLRTRTPAEHTIQALENSRVTRFLRDDMIRLYQQIPGLEALGRDLLEQLMSDQERQVNLYTRYSPAERYRQLLVYWPELSRRVPLKHIASYLGVARETLSRIRKRR